MPQHPLTPTGTPNPLEAAWVSFVFSYWWLCLLLAAGAFFWPWLVRGIRWAGRRLLLGARTSGLNRVEGMLYCAQCAAELAPEAASGAFTVRACPRCGGNMKSLESGSFAGSRATVLRCASCGGYWLSRIDWVSFELGI